MPGADRLPGRVLAIDIGGTKMAAGIVDERGTIQARAVIPTPVGTTADELYAALLALVRGVLAGEPSPPCGVGCGGPMSRSGRTVSPLNIHAWRDFPLLARLRDDLATNVIVDNDAKALALAEGWLGAAAGVGNYLAMVVSTGVGGGLVVDGNLLDGESGNAGHIGHVVVVPEGNACGCGGFGCLEAEISGTGILARTGLQPRDTDLTERRRDGHLLGLALAGAVALLDLRVVAVGGSVALGFGEPFFAAAQATFDRHARLGYTRETRIVPAGLGADAPLIGAAALAFRALSSR